MDGQRFAPYHLVGQPRWTDVHAAWAAGRRQTQATVCVLGDSHAKLLGPGDPAEEREMLARGVDRLFWRAHWPQELAWRAPMRNCSHLVVLIGQWSSGWGAPLPNRALPKPRSHVRRRQGVAAEAGWRSDVAGALARLRQTAPPAARVYVASVNLNPLTGLSLQCPPKDWRTPPVLDMYNEVLRRTAGPAFIDNRGIQGPVWDAGPDLNHPDGIVMGHEWRNVLYHIFSVEAREGTATTTTTTTTTPPREPP